MSREKASDHLAILEARHAQSLIIPVPREALPYYKIFFHRLKLKRQREQRASNAQFAPLRANLHCDLISVSDALPPGIQGRERHLPNNAACSSIGQCNSVLWSARQLHQQLMLAFGKTREGPQSFIRAQAFYERPWTATAQ